ncbi:MAG TPA: DMT family transporter [Burkholderiales bacterium]|jgi:drug/metabolite transporter (DMT)-like permease|nr:DMT family transporter [Burkholderiales bacterium]
MTTAREHRVALLMMIGATLCWASAGVLVRNMRITDGWEITFWRSLFMTVFLGGWLALQHRGAIAAKVCAVGFPGLVSAALLTTMYVGFILALSRTTVANTLVVISSAPFFTALFAFLALRERVPARTWIAMSVAASGIVLMFLESLSGEGWKGMLLALAVPLAFGVNIVLLRKMRASVDMIPGILLSGVLSMIVTLPLALPFQVEGRDLGLLAIMGAVQLGLGCVLMVIASRHLTAAEIGLTSILETVFGTLSVWVLVGERPSAAALTGGAMVIGALAANQLAALRARPAPVRD